MSPHPRLRVVGRRSPIASRTREACLERHLLQLLLRRLVSLAQSDGFSLEDRVLHDLSFVEHHLRNFGPGELPIYSEDEQRLLVGREALAQLRDLALGSGARARESRGTNARFDLGEGARAGERQIACAAAARLANV